MTRQEDTPAPQTESEAVERAAIAWFDRGQAQRMDAGRKRPDGGPWQWDDLTESDKRGYRALVAPIVSAALEVSHA